jgi:hypothetical protein
MDRSTEDTDEARKSAPSQPVSKKWPFMLFFIPLLATYFLLLFLRDAEFMRAYFWPILWRAFVAWGTLVIGSRIIDTAITELPEKLDGLNLWGAIMKAYTEIVVKLRELWNGLRKKSRVAILILLFVGCFIWSFYSYQPYRIPAICRAGMSARLAEFTAIKINVSNYSGDNAALQLGKDIMATAQSAGWSVSPDQGIPSSFMVGRGELYEGVEITFYGFSAPDAPKGMIAYDTRQQAAANALKTEMRRLRIRADVVGPLPGDTETAKTISINVGPKR